MRKKTNKIKSYLFIGLIVTLLLGISTVSARYSLLDRIVDRAGDLVGNRLVDESNIIDEINAEIEKIVEEEPEIGGAFINKWSVQNGLMTVVEHADMNDASTTLFSVHNPFGSPTSTDTAYTQRQDPKLLKYDATTTVDFLGLNITATGTSTAQLLCGASSDGYTAPANYHLFQMKITTTTVGYYENNTATTTGGHATIGTGSVAKIILTPDFSHFVCSATGTDAAYWGGNASLSKNGIIGSNNTFDGTITARFTRGTD